jgi:hypothetical protein
METIAKRGAHDGRATYTSDADAWGDLFPRISRHEHVERLERADRLRPVTSGTVAGLFAGAAAVASAVVVERALVWSLFERVASALFVDAESVRMAAFIASALVGAVIGACFAKLTHHLRRFFPLLLWSVIFFSSVVILFLAIARSGAERVGVAIDPASARAIVVATLTFACVVVLELPLRRRRH